MYRKGVACIIVNKNNEILLINLMSFEYQYFSLPGGGIDNGETKIDALKRELFEELGLEDNKYIIIKEDAKKLLIEQVETELTGEKAKKVRIVEEEIKLQAEEKAKEILINAMEQTVSDYVAPATTYILDLPNDDIKGKIIGKEGRNIRAFEKATGVDLIIDDVPGSITISCFDPYRREIAILASSFVRDDISSSLFSRSFLIFSDSSLTLSIWFSFSSTLPALTSISLLRLSIISSL